MRVFSGVRRGVLIAEVWPNDAFADGRGINTITGGCNRPYGGAAFHDNQMWIRPGLPSGQFHLLPGIRNRRGTGRRRFRKRRAIDKIRKDAVAPSHSPVWLR